jgi:hypothetical protein
VFHGGPVWYYLLSLPLLLSSNWVVMNLWVGFLTGLKYLLAYACGTRLVDRSFGLAWACLLALPDWTSVNYLIFSHTNLAEAGLLLCFYCLVRWQQGSVAWFLLMCFAIGLGIHAHPTVYAAGLVAAPFVVRSLRRRELVWWMLPLGGVAACLPLFPYLVSQSLSGWPDLQTGQGYFASQPLWMNLAGFWDVLRGALLEGPLTGLRHVLSWQGTPLIVAGLALLLVLGGGLGLGLFALLRGQADRMAGLLLAATLICIAAVAIIRQVTPFYQTFVIYPPFYGLVAWGWWWLGTKTGFPVARLLVPFGLASLVGSGMATLQMGREGQLAIPVVALMDVRTHATGELADTIYYPGWGRQQLGGFICELGRPAYFHGFASLVLEQSYALEAKMRCDTTDVYMGGKGAGSHYLGVNHHAVRQLGIAGGRELGSMSLYETSRVIAPDEAMTIPEGHIYPPRPYHSTGSVQRSLDFEMAAGEMMSITNLYHYWMPYSIEVRMSGDPADPLFRSSVNAYYGCSDCPTGSIQEWSVTIEAPKPELVEVVTFTPDRPVP